ncbi:uncharacterized protein LOC129001025 [Macrosteles quadrilineatus]|uniref:uncharacterized protein LOC129001025 n=1 Tax=Macrosteles quadrilineatus TaxID=74068 RepID=UPI0023E1AF0E|nr:uncharacterized protein LOC129001025 [Macrosteles quadrilineatus]
MITVATSLVCVCIWGHHVAGQRTRADLLDEEVADSTRLFRGLDSVKDYFRNNTNPLAKQILETFENECFYMEEPELPSGRQRRPFIVIEGNHKSSREVVGVRLAGMLDGRYLVHPASCLIRYSDILPKGSLIRRAYYVLSLYAMSFNVKINLSLGRAVVVNGYWLDQLTWNLIHAQPGETAVPPASSSLLDKPPDLFTPDLIFYLNLPDDLFYRQVTTRSPRNWKSRVLSLYQSLQTRYPIVIQDLERIYRAAALVVYRHLVLTLSDVRYEC